jgi:FtsZ-interacting cell division protein ZipA
LLIVIGALVLAILIVALGFWIAARRRSDAAQRRQIEERLQQLRGPSAAPPE